MGKPLYNDMEHVAKTLHWAVEEADITAVASYLATISDKPLLAIGSGGSYSAAHFLARLHQFTCHKPAQALTVLEYIQGIALPDHAVCMLSAGGGNIDALRSWNLAIERDHSRLAALVMQPHSKLEEAAKHTGGTVFSFDIPGGKDGFLATNSLLGTCALLLRGVGYQSDNHEKISQNVHLKAKEELLARGDWLVLSGGWAWPAAIDLESKCSEAALARILLSDLRNFGHGRHVWLAKRPETSAVVVLSTPDERQLVKRTLDQIPDTIPRLVLESDTSGPWATIKLLTDVLELVRQLGTRFDWDPGRPGVPRFGEKIYHLGPVGLISRHKTSPESVWLQRKQNAMGLPKEAGEALKPALKNFLSGLEQTRFSALVLDYDGTLCEPEARFKAMSPAIAAELNRLLAAGLQVGIATGRGKSVAKCLCEAIDPAFHKQVFVAYYNGAILCCLSEPVPEQGDELHPEIKAAMEILLPLKLEKLEERKHQISITVRGGNIPRLCSTLRNLLASVPDIKIFHSQHSVDILAPTGEKLNIYQALTERGKVLAIGNCGNPGGNDEELLNTPLALSCHASSTNPNTGWHLGLPGRYFSRATLGYLRALLPQGNGTARLDIKRLKQKESYEG